MQNPLLLRKFDDFVLSLEFTKCNVFLNDYYSEIFSSRCINSNL